MANKLIACLKECMTQMNEIVEGNRNRPRRYSMPSNAIQDR